MRVSCPCTHHIPGESAPLVRHHSGEGWLFELATQQSLNSLTWELLVLHYHRDWVGDSCGQGTSQAAKRPLWYLSYGTQALNQGPWPRTKLSQNCSDLKVVALAPLPDPTAGWCLHPAWLWGLTAFIYQCKQGPFLTCTFPQNCRSQKKTTHLKITEKFMSSVVFFPCLFLFYLLS